GRDGCFGPSGPMGVTYRRAGLVPWGRHAPPLPAEVNSAGPLPTRALCPTQLSAYLGAFLTVCRSRRRMGCADEAARGSFGAGALGSLQLKRRADSYASQARGARGEPIGSPSAGNSPKKPPSLGDASSHLLERMGPIPRCGPAATAEPETCQRRLAAPEALRGAAEQPRGR